MISIREGIRRILPSWFLDRVDIGKTTAFRLLYSFALLLDAAVQAAIEGVRLRFPELAHSSALPYLGRDRRLFRGPFQTDDQYAAALLEWRSIWLTAGNAKSLARALQLYLDPLRPRVRVVNRAGFWTTLNSDGSLQFKHASNWDWDSNSNPEREDEWQDIWVIVYQPHFGLDGEWGDGTSTWGQLDAFGKLLVTGQDTNVANASQIWAQIDELAGAHANVRAIIWTYDDTAFDPEADLGDPSLPDGYWGRWHKVVGGVAVRSRRDDCRYWER